jgi:ribonuclease-3
MKKQNKQSQILDEKKLKRIEKNLGVSFKNRDILIQALIHRSWLNENFNPKHRESNERLEFLGDAILEFWVTKKLFFMFPKLPEGSLTNIRAALVRTETLAQKAKSIGLNKYLLLSRGEEKNGGRKNISILADALEEMIGVIFEDAGLNATEKFLGRLLNKELREKGEKGDIKDAKTKLQEISQAKFKETPIYQLVDQSGPDHHKVFTSAVLIGKKKVATGKGASKQESQEKAASKALTLIQKKIKIAKGKVKGGRNA